VGEKRNIYLIGPMGSGKTAVGRQLAAELGLEFVDSDTEIENRTGVDITYIFDKEGEAGFRQREQAVIRELIARDHLVVATGGGAVIADENRRNLAETGIVVYLRTTVEQQLERTRRTKNRPLLNNGDPAEVLGQLMALRGPLYEEIATFSADTGNRRVKTVVTGILNALQVYGFAPLKN